MAKKPVAICFFCGEQPCACAKIKKAKATPVAKAATTSAAPTPTVEPEIVFAPTPRVVRKITSAAPGVTSFPSSVPEPIVPVLKKIERHLSDEDLVDAIAIQNLISGGLVTVSDNPHLGGIATMKLTAQERARGWKVML
jgi:hypothetical protein